MPQTETTNATLEQWNHLEGDESMRAILPCNGSEVWAAGLVDARPFDKPEDCFAASDRVWSALPEEAWQQAFDSHPRIGERTAKAATSESLAMSADEQTAANPDAATQSEFAAANMEYEARFGRIFIVCATGKTAAQMLAILRSRLGNDTATELQEAAEQQRQITQLRLHKWLGV